MSREQVCQEFEFVFLIIQASVLTGIFLVILINI